MIHKGKVSCPVYKRAVKTTGTTQSFSSQLIGHREVTISLFVDSDALVRELGEKAFRNRTHKAREVGGLVEARVVGIGELVPVPEKGDAKS